MWTVLPGVVLGVFLGRFFCGWACPYLPVLAASNASRWVLTRHDSRSLVTPLTPRFEVEMLPALYRMRTPEPVPPPVKARTLGGERFPLHEVYNREAQGELLSEAILNGQPYPVRALMLWASNALVTASGTRRLAKAAEALELLVTVDPFLSASAQRSDVVLPAATFAESQDIDADDEKVDARSLVPAQGDAGPDWKILRQLAHALGLGTYFPWETLHEAMSAPHVTWMEEPRFGTMSGKAEFASTLLEQHGYEPLPSWTAPTEPRTSEFPLRLVTGPRPRARINSQSSQSPSVTARMREPEALLHPEVAKATGARHGQPVDIFSPYGRIRLRAVVTEDVHPECVVVPAGWAEANPNLLISDARRDPISGFPAFRSGVCRIEPLQGS